VLGSLPRPPANICGGQNVYEHLISQTSQTVVNLWVRNAYPQRLRRIHNQPPLDSRSQLGVPRDLSRSHRPRSPPLLEILAPMIDTTNANPRFQERVEPKYVLQSSSSCFGASKANIQHSRSSHKPKTSPRKSLVRW